MSAKEKRRGGGGAKRNCYMFSLFDRKKLPLLQASPSSSVCVPCTGWIIIVVDGWVIMNPEMIDPSMTLGKSKKCSHKQDKLMSSQAL